MPTCKTCQSPLVIGARFCRECGAPAIRPKHSRRRVPGLDPLTPAQQLTSAEDRRPSFVNPDPTNDQQPLDATQHLPPLPSETTQGPPRVGFGASTLETMTKMRERRARAANVDEPTGGQRGKIGMIIAGAIALVVAAVLLIAAMNMRNAGNLPDAEGVADTAAVTNAVELISSAHIGVPGTASNSRDWAGNTVTFVAANLADGDPTTAWRTSGDATSDDLTVQWNEAHTIAELGLINGYAKIDKARQEYDWYRINRRVLAVTWIFADGTEVRQEFDETPQLQTITLDQPITTQTVRLRIDEVSDPAGKDFTALSELTVRGE